MFQNQVVQRPAIDFGYVQIVPVVLVPIEKRPDALIQT